MASKVATMSQQENNIPTSQHEDHVGNFFEFITQHCVKRGYQGLQNVCKENDDIKRQLTEKDTTNQALMAELARQQGEAHKNRDLQKTLAQKIRDYEAIKIEQEKEAAELTRLYQQDKTSKATIERLEAQNTAGGNDLKKARAEIETVKESLQNKRDLQKELERLKSFSVKMDNAEGMRGKM